MVAGFSGHDEHLANVAKSQRIYFHFRHTLKKKSINQCPSTFLITNELFIPFSFFVGFGRQSYKNVYLHFLKVLPVLPCKRKPS